MATEIINPEAMQLVESIKIIKNTKGYQWEYKLLGTVEEQLNRIDNVEKILLSKFEKSTHTQVNYTGGK